MSNNRTNSIAGTNITIRGGRMTKFKGQAASYAPHLGLALGGVSGTALAMGLAVAGVMLTPGAAQAGTCVETAPGSGIWDCTGDFANDPGQTISGAGDVTVTAQPGFNIITAGTAITVSGSGNVTFNSPTSSTVRGMGGDSLNISNTGAGALSVTGSGIFFAQGGTSDGIHATNSSNGTSLSLASYRTLGAQDGVDATNNGTGALTITSSGLSQGDSGNGIYGSNSTNGTDLTITAVSSFGGTNGIRARNYGSGALSITFVNDARGYSGYGVWGSNGSAGTSLTINAHNSAGTNGGIEAANNGTGALTINSTGLASGTNAYANGIRAFNGINGTSLTITANNTEGTTEGIEARNEGTGALTITSSGTTNGTNGDGIYAFNGMGATNLTVVANNSTGGFRGIDALNLGTGALAVTASGTSSGTGAEGILARNSGNGTDLTITANNSSGGSDGIFGRNYGTGALSITSSGTATGANRDGIVANNSANGTSLTITSNTATGRLVGIDGRNYGSGALTITSSGDATGSIYEGIFALNRGTDLTVIANNTTGGGDGIESRNYGRGALSITSTGNATGGSAGIRAINTIYGTSLTVNANNSSGRYDAGIESRNYGRGALSITSTGNASSTYSDGIRAYNFYYGTDLTINANNSTGYIDGIEADNNGFGNLSITSTGTASGAYGDGIQARNGGFGYLNLNFGPYGFDLTITANNSSGYDDGIDAINRGSSALTITSTGLAQGGYGDGIYARNGNSNYYGVFGTNLTITANNSSGFDDGIDARNSGVGSLSITSTGTASGEYGDGIRARNGGYRSGSYAFGVYGTDLTIVANNSSGYDDGIDATNLGSGALSITSTGLAQGTYGDGIHARNGGNFVYGAFGTNLTITANNASGWDDGIDARNNGSGALTVTATGSVNGNYGHGIYAKNGSYYGGPGTNLTVAANNTFGYDDGIYAANYGSGALAVTSTGMASGAVGYGIYAWNSDNGTTLTVTANNASGGISGIHTESYGNGDATVILNGTAQGGTGAAIDTFTNAGLPINAPGSSTTIFLQATSHALAGSSGVAIRNNEGNSTLAVASGGRVTGSITLGDGSDVVNLAGNGVLAGITLLDGGDDMATGDGMTDVLSFNNVTATTNGANVINWEVINIANGTLGFTNAALSTGILNVNSGGRLDGSNSLAVTADVNVAAGGAVIAGNAAGNSAMRIVGNLANAGTIDMRSPTGLGAAGDRLTVTGNHAGVSGSIIRFDTALAGDGSPTDRMIVNGNLTGTSTLLVTNVGGAGALTSGDGIKLVQVDGTSAAGALSLAGVSIDVGAFRYQLYNGGLSDPNDQDWYLRSRMRDISAPMSSVARVSQDMGLTSLGTMHERTGEQRVGTGGGALKGLWGRVFGKDYSETAQSATLGDSRSNGQLGGMQMGLDLYSNGSTSFGAYGGKLWSGTTDFIATPSFSHAGTTRSDGWVAGAYLSHIAPSGWYADVVVQGGWFDHRANALDGTNFSTNSRNMLGSVEVGKAFGSSWQFEPQLQLIYSHNTIDSFVDSAGTATAVDVDDAVVGRAGFRIKRTWDYKPDSAGGQFTFYGKANIWSTFSGGKTTIVSGTSLPQSVEFKQTWGDVGLGTSFSVGKGAELYADADVEFGIDQPATALGGKVGVRIRW